MATITEQLAKHARERCRHFNGTQEQVCKAGVRYEDVKAPPDRLPCFAYTGLAANCPQASFPTPEEAQAIAEERAVGIELWSEGSRRARAAAKGVKGGSGTVECPKCKGVLHWSKSSYNGHVWGECETAGCIAWME